MFKCYSSSSRFQARSSQYLDNEEEQALSDHLVHAAKMGYGKSRKQVVESVAREKDVLRSSCVSDGWWRRFLQRQPDYVEMRQLMCA